MIPGRSYTIAAGVDVDSADAQGVLWAAGGVAGGHALYVKDNKLRYTFNWIGSHYQDVVASANIAAGPPRVHRRVHGNGPQHRPRTAREPRAR